MADLEVAEVEVVVAMEAVAMEAEALVGEDVVVMVEVVIVVVEVMKETMGVEAMEGTTAAVVADSTHMVVVALVIIKRNMAPDKAICSTSMIQLCSCQSVMH